MKSTGYVTIRKGREKSLERKHPWVFSGSINESRSNTSETEPGGLVDILSEDGSFLARGYYNQASQMRVRILSWDEDEAMGDGWWRLKIAQAAARRESYAEEKGLTAYRLVFGESDGLPGLIIDRYGDIYVFQALTLGIEVRKQAIIDALAALFTPRSIIERSDVDVRLKEGLTLTSGLVHGDPPSPTVLIEEMGITYPFDVISGQKTGFYLDQREAREWLLTSPEVREAEVLNCFGYTGSFTACALKNGAAHVTTVDSSEDALAHARETLRLNQLEDNRADFVTGDVFQILRQYRDADREFDLIILDPPKFAQTASQVESAARGYKDINLLAFQLLRPGGVLMTFSCSGAISEDLFQKIIFGASIDADVDAQIIQWLNQPPDHPVLLTFPEARYLKGLICKRV